MVVNRETIVRIIEENVTFTSFRNRGKIIVTDKIWMVSKFIVREHNILVGVIIIWYNKVIIIVRVNVFVLLHKFSM